MDKLLEDLTNAMMQSLKATYGIRREVVEDTFPTAEQKEEYDAAVRHLQVCRDAVIAKRIEEIELLTLAQLKNTYRNTDDLAAKAAFIRRVAEIIAPDDLEASIEWMKCSGL